MEDNIKLDPRKLSCEVGVCVELSQDGVRRLDLVVSEVMKLYFLPLSIIISVVTSGMLIIA